MLERIRRWFARPHLDTHRLTMGDRVSIRENDDRIAAAYAGRCGIVYGDTTPSISGVPVIGTTRLDYAVNVRFDGTAASAWYARELLEFVGRTAGTAINVDGKTYTLRADGGWDGPH